MAGRHRKPPAWRRMMTRLLRSDRAARTAALQAEVATLRATVAALRAELVASRSEVVRTAAEAEAARAASARAAGELARSRAVVSLDLPLVSLASLQQAAAPVPMPLDLGPDTARTEVVLTERAALPEADLLDPVADRDAQPVRDLPVERTGPTGGTGESPRRAIA